MSVSRRRLRAGAMECGYDMSDTPKFVHGIGVVVMSMSMLFSYAALLENGPLPAVTGFVFGFGFLLLIYGHHFDRFYFHVGNKVKIGGDAYDPNRERAEFVEIEDDE